MTTAGMALVELFMLYASFKAKDFQRDPTPANLSDWCNAKELTYEPYRNHERIAA